VRKSFLILLLAGLMLAGCGGSTALPGSGGQVSKAPDLTFGPALRPGRAEANPAWPFLRTGPDGRLYLIYTEVDRNAGAPAAAPADGSAAGHDHSAGAGIRAAFLIASGDGGGTWTEPLRVNDQVENVQGDENEPKLAFGQNGQVYAAWSIPNAKGDKMRANIRWAMLDAQGKFTPAVTLNAVPDAARFAAMQTAPDGTLLAAWIDRRLDSPTPRQIYMTRLGPDGKVLTQNAQIADDSCECCRITLAFADGGRTVYIAYRQKTPENIRDIVIRKSTDGGATFGAPVKVSDDGWVIAGCPHAGAVMTTDSRGYVHVIWYTQGRNPDKETGIYYTVSKDGGATFAPRRLIAKAGGPEVLRPYLAVGEQGEVYLAWMNLQAEGEGTQIYFRTLSADGKTLSPVQQLSQAEGNAVWPYVTVSQDRAYVAWTETKGEASWIVLRSAPVTK
jgi:hypothetical protein